MLEEILPLFEKLKRGENMAQTILYYPKINIQDGAWLRSAILYWDEVASIVPYEEYEYFSHELLYLQNLGIYKAIYPQDLFSSEFAEDFCNSVVKRINAYDKRLSAGNVDENRCGQVRIHRNKIYAPALHNLIHYNKLPQNLLEYLKDKRFINDYNTDGWMEIDSKIAQIYMKTLAEYSIKCSDKDIVLGTDTASCNQEIYSYAHKRSQTQCCKINIERCLPQPSTDVSYEDILDFKAKRKDEFQAFRAKIRELETNIYNADGLELIKHYENQFMEDWERCCTDYYRVLKEARIPFFLSSLISLVAIPCVRDFISSELRQDSTAAIQSGSQILNIGISYLNYRNKISQTKSDGGFSYIIKANRDGIVNI